VAGSGLEALMEGHSLLNYESIDDAVVGLIVALGVFWYEQKRHRAILDKVRVISAMNHHVRNALQVLSYSPYADHEQQIKLVEDSVRRIQWALQEILPGEDIAGTHIPPNPPEESP
jgi:hypothetical protein